MSLYFKYVLLALDLAIFLTLRICLASPSCFRWNLLWSHAWWITILVGSYDPGLHLAFSGVYRIYLMLLPIAAFYLFRLLMVSIILLSFGLIFKLHL